MLKLLQMQCFVYYICFHKMYLGNCQLVLVATSKMKQRQIIHLHRESERERERCCIKCILVTYGMRKYMLSTKRSNMSSSDKLPTQKTLFSFYGWKASASRISMCIPLSPHTHTVKKEWVQVRNGKSDKCFWE